MSRVETSIDIALPPEVVWEFVMDPAHSNEWVTIHRKNGRCDDGPLTPGFEMEQTLCLRGVNFKVKWELTELDAPRYAVWEGRGPARSHARIEDRLTAVNGGTRFHYVNEFKAPLGPLGAVASRALVGGMPRKEADASLLRLKEILERSHA
jgi:carbon monoxide dehydrogenase subunit G